MAVGNMAIFSKLVQQWHVSQAGEVKVCVLGLTMTTDSPKFLLLTVTCGLVSASLLSSASRAFLQRLWQQACHWCSAAVQANQLAPSAPPVAPVVKAPKMGQKMTVTTSVQLSTDPFEPELDLLTSYEIVDLPRLRVRTRDAQTSPIPPGWLARDVGVATLAVDTQERSVSPISTMYESASPDELLLMFEGEEMRDGAGVSLSGDNTELYEKLGSIQKALQEANQEMDSYMSTLSEISQRHLCSPLHTGRGYPPLIPFSASSTDSSNALTWEDEFNTSPSSSTLAPPRTDPFSRNNPSQPDFSSTDLSLWQSDLGFYAGLSSAGPQTDTAVETEPGDPYSANRDSGCGDLWDVAEGTPETGTVCVGCGGLRMSVRRTAKRPVSAPSGSGCLTPNLPGAVSCDFPPDAVCASCCCGRKTAVASLSGSQSSGDRVPKSRTSRKL